MQNEQQSNTRDTTFTRLLNAPRELVWDAFTKQEHIEKWWGPRGFSIQNCKWEAKAGGQIYMEMVGHGMNAPMDGEFIELVKPGRIVFKSAALDSSGKRLFEIMNTLTLTEEGGKTRLTLDLVVSNIKVEGMHNLDGMNIGWNQTLDKLEEHLTNA